MELALNIRPAGERVREILYEYIEYSEFDSTLGVAVPEIEQAGLDYLFQGKVVDLGAGSGKLAELAVKAGAEKVYAVDVAPLPEHTDSDKLQWVYADFADFSKGMGFSAEAVGMHSCGEVPAEFLKIEKAHKTEFVQAKFDLGLISWPLNKRHVANMLPALEKCDKLLLILGKDKTLGFGTVKLFNYLEQRKIVRTVDTPTQKCVIYGPPTADSKKLAESHSFEW